MLGGPHYLMLLPTLLWFEELWPFVAGWLLSLLLPWPWLATVRAERRER